MTVYVDDMRAPYGRMIMCHMIGDDEAELHAMAARIGVARRWYQGNHYDVSLSMRRKAVAAGAIEITQRQAGCMVAVAKRTGAWPPPEEAEERLITLHRHARAGGHPEKRDTEHTEDGAGATVTSVRPSAPSVSGRSDAA